MKKKVMTSGVTILTALMLVMAIFVGGGAILNKKTVASAAESTIVEITTPGTAIPNSDGQLICGQPVWSATENSIKFERVHADFGGQYTGKGSVHSTFGDLYSDTFILKAVLDAPNANNELTGFYFYSTVMVAGFPDYDTGEMFSLYNNGTDVYLRRGTVNGTPEFIDKVAGATAVGAKVDFTIVMSSTGATVTAKVGDNTATTTTVTNLKAKPAPGTPNYAGFVTNDVGATISKISMENKADSAAAGYKRFGLYGVTSVGLDETEYTILNNNINEYAGDMVQTDSYLKAKSLHASLTRTITFSKFGKGYDKDFEGQFDVKAPSGSELSTGGNNAGAGLFFRSTQAMESSKGIYILVENIKAKDSGTTLGKLALKIYAVNSNITTGSVGVDVGESEFATPAAAFGEFLTIKFSVKNNVIKANAYLATAPTVSILVAANATTGITATTTQDLKKEDQTCGFYSVNFLPTYKNIVLTNKTTGADNNKTFNAYPFNEDSLVGTTDTYELYSPKAINYKTGAIQEKGVAITQENKDSGELHLGGETPHDDGGLIGTYNTVFYFRYSATANKILARKAGANIESPAEYEVNNGPDFSWTAYKDYLNVNRHAYAAIIYNDYGYVAARVEGVIHVLPKKVQVSGVTAVSRAYDSTRSVALAGGTITGVIGSEEVVLNLGKGSVPSINVGNDYAVTTTIQLAGKDSGNYIIEAQPTGLKVNITKGKMEKPEAPVLESVTTTSITVTEVFGAEYSKDGTTWQDSNVFEGLSAKTEYTIYMRIKGDDNAVTSDSSDVLSVKTEGKKGCGSIVANDTNMIIAIIAIISLTALMSFVAIKGKKAISNNNDQGGNK